VNKFFFLLVLAMVGYFLLKNRVLGFRRPEATGEDRKPPREDLSGAAEMVVDPVCGTYVEPADAVSIVHEGRRFSFCSEACRDRFLQQPRS
jgi:YHS domain-containing protein